MCLKFANKNYYVVGDAGFARPRNTLKIISNFFLINESMNQSIHEQGIPRTAHPPSKIGVNFKPA